INLTGAWYSNAWTPSQQDYTINLTVSWNGVTVTHNGINVGAIDPAFPTGVVGTITVNSNGTFSVDSLPSITSPASAVFTTGTSGSFTVTAGGSPPLTWSETGTLPT